jgi:uncharacterized protein (DUF488 family)
MTLYTIGFTKKSAEEFFGLLRAAGVGHMLDIRLNPRSQLAGFANQRDLPYLLREILQCDYTHLPILAPGEELLADYRQNKDWPQYEQRYARQLQRASAIEQIDRKLLIAVSCCLLCSEEKPDQCHRRLAAEYVQSF